MMPTSAIVPSLGSHRGPKLKPNRLTVSPSLIAKSALAAVVLVNFAAYWRFFHQLGNAKNGSGIGKDGPEVSVAAALSSSSAREDSNRVDRESIASSTRPLSVPDPKAKSLRLTLPRVMAIYFPQYHREPLNDKLWGDGFTDWDNLRRSPAANRLGLPIPRPTELGYYDLVKDRDVRRKQAELAAEHGVDGFVYHHYWFHDPNVRPGRPNLHGPLMEMLKDGHPDMPFFFNWCNHHWSNTWSGAMKPKIQNTGFDDNMLQQQFLPRNMTLVDEHYDWLRQFFHHPNYIKVDGGTRPVFMVYHWKPGLIEIFKRFQERAKADGFPNGLYLMASRTQTHDELFVDGRSQGQRRNPYPRGGLVDRTVAYPQPLEMMERRVLTVPEWCSEGGDRHPPIRQVAGILSSFDNTPRRTVETAHLWSPDPAEIVLDRFRASLKAAVTYETCCLNDDSADDKFVLINAWNEWAEGMALEPSDVYGRGFLEAIKEVKDGMGC